MILKEEEKNLRKPKLAKYGIFLLLEVLFLLGFF
tara:strand:- start:3430 stop:3531 length:102 start_codon:yes stop_codon:yes gene_type:complete